MPIPSFVKDLKRMDKKIVFDTALVLVPLGVKAVIWLRFHCPSCFQDL